MVTLHRWLSDQTLRRNRLRVIAAVYHLPSSWLHQWWSDKLTRGREELPISSVFAAFNNFLSINGSTFANFKFSMGVTELKIGKRCIYSDLRNWFKQVPAHLWLHSPDLKLSLKLQMTNIHYPFKMMP